jgi:hypothetical protein
MDTALLVALMSFVAIVAAAVLGGGVAVTIMRLFGHDVPERRDSDAGPDIPASGNRVSYAD